MSSDRAAIPPLVVEFTVEAPVRHAFETWVRSQHIWWPKSHTISGDPDAIIVEPRVGGRIYERDANGAEHEWGEVLDWVPPNRLQFLWHLFFSREEATVVDVTFHEVDERTSIRLVQTGWDRLGAEGPIRRERTIAGWAAVMQRYRRLVDQAPQRTERSHP